MSNPESSQRFFYTSTELQDFLLTQSPDSLIVVPHLRLAHQVWRRQRLAAQAAGQAAWEPVPMMTLSGWLQHLCHRLWLPVRLAGTLDRLVLWLQAMAAAPPEEGITSDLSWAARLDEAHDLCQRYCLPPPKGPEAQASLIAWRENVFQNFGALLAERGLSTTAALPALLHQALSRGELTLPARIVLVALETPTPGEQQWLAAVARQRPVLQVRLAGRQEVSLRGVPLPDRRQETEWVAAQVLESAHNQGVPLHRLALTAPNLETYLPDLRRIFQELLGPAMTESGGRYNFSLGPTLAETPLFQAALLPLTFALAGEQRQDLIGWLRSPLYGAFRRHENIFSRWDVSWRHNAIASGWDALQRGRIKNGRAETDTTAWDLVNQAYARLPAGPAPLSLWRRRLLEIWELLEFPSGLQPPESGEYQACLDLLQEFSAAGEGLTWTAADLVEWLNWGASRRSLASEGSMDAGIQIQGLLELRGLDFDRIFCLGLNMGVFPPAPRQLPLLTCSERALVLGGDYQSQLEFARISYRYLLAAAPNLILTRPLVDQDEEQVASYMIPPTIWEEQPVTFAALSQVHPAWLRSPAVQAAFGPGLTGGPTEAEDLVTIALPDQISLSALETALACPCRFLLEILLELEELPEVEPGLPPAERGSVIHEILQNFTTSFLVSLQELGTWDDRHAWQHLQEAVAGRTRGVDDPYWEAEIARWLEEPGGLLREWLCLEKQRYEEGWEWLAMEASFCGLRIPGWPTPVRGRLDRVDRHPSQGLLLWDYKTGTIPHLREITENSSKFQLLGYLMALEQNLTGVPPHPETRAGIIGLKSSRTEHLQHEDYQLSSIAWQELRQDKLAAVARVGERAGQGDFRPDPCQPPPARVNSCQYCPFQLVCAYCPATGAGEAE